MLTTCALAGPTPGGGASPQPLDLTALNMCLVLSADQERKCIGIANN